MCVRVYAGLSFFLSCSSPSSSFSVVVRTGDEGLTKCAQNRQPSQKIHSSHSAHPPSSLIAHCVCKSVKERVCRLSARLLAVRLEYRTVRWLGLGCATTGHPTATNKTHPETFATLLILYFRRPHEVPHMHHHLALRRNRKHRKTQKKTHKKERSGRWDSFVRCSLSVRCSLLVVRERRRERAGLSTVCHLPPATVTQSTRVKKFKSSAKITGLMRTEDSSVCGTAHTKQTPHSRTHVSVGVRRRWGEVFWKWEFGNSGIVGSFEKVEIQFVYFSYFCIFVFFAELEE